MPTGKNPHVEPALETEPGAQPRERDAEGPPDGPVPQEPATAPENPADDPRRRATVRERKAVR